MEEEALASAANWVYMNISNKYLRPLAGEINVNTFHGKNIQERSYWNIRELRRTFYHEISHALAYSSENYNFFIDENGEFITQKGCIVQGYKFDDGNLDYFLSHPKMKQLIHDYYKCDINSPYNIGFPLSQKDKSHFHQQISFEDIMRPLADDFDERVSIFILTLYDITGWYIVDYRHTEKTIYGKGKGCNFVNLYCEDEEGRLFEEYCDPSKNQALQRCNYYHESVSICRIITEETNNRCGYYFPLEGGRCKAFKTSKEGLFEFGPNSKCIEIKSRNQDDAICTPSRCDKKEKAIYIKIEDEEYKAVYADLNKTGKLTAIPEKIFIKKYDLEVYFPKSYERFCFIQEHPKPEDKLFKR